MLLSTDMSGESEETLIYDVEKKIPESRKERLDSFFEVLKLTAGKGYVFFADIRYDFSRWDKRTVENYKLPSEYMYRAGEIWEQMVHPDDRDDYVKAVGRAFNGEIDKFELSYKVKEPSGNYVPCTCNGLVIKNQQGEPEYFGGALFIRDNITSTEISDERKYKLDSLFEVLAAISDDSNVFLCDMQYDYSKWSKGLVEEFDLPSQYIYNATGMWEERIHPDDRQTYRESMHSINHYKTNVFDLQYRVRRADGEYNVCSGLGILIHDENGYPDYFGGMIRNLTHYSCVDTLTGLRNQYGFFEDIATSIQQNKELRIAILGISKLAEINALHGYNFGNAVLKRFGTYFEEYLGDRGVVYRLEGSKFGAIVEHTAYEEAEKSYNRIRKHFREGIEIDGVFIDFELNASTLLLNEFDTDGQTIYSCLNFAYNESKNDKQGRIIEFKNDLLDDEKLKIARIHMIRNSITKGYKGFYLLYQPVVDVDTEKLIGAEALIRWKNEKYGVVPPDEFIPILEADPLFPELGEWILLTALMDAKKMLEKYPNFVINVNLSYVQIAQPNFVDKVKNILRITGYPAKQLCLELTERCRLLDVNLLRNVIVALRSEGIRIALDDFGTGYSSLGLMKNLPLDTIKIDRSFVQKIEEDDKEQKLVNNLVNFAKIFETKVCVEGVETSKMREILKTCGINSLQGYYYSKPIPNEEIMAKYGL